jgi:peptidase E
MTKYILNSGGIRKDEEKAKKFFAEVVHGLGSRPKILLCMFAVPREDWSEKYAKFTERELNFFPQGVDPIFSIAYPKTFAEQVKDTDIVYMFGGDTHLALFWLKQLNVPEVWEGKVVAASSATSMALSSYAWSCDWREPFAGLGIVPGVFIAHYGSDFGALDMRGPIDWNVAKKEVEALHLNVPIHAVNEGDYIIFEQ